MKVRVGLHLTVEEAQALRAVLERVAEETPTPETYQLCQRLSNKLTAVVGAAQSVTRKVHP